MTWAKTGYTQAVGKEEPFYESRCFCLTSIELIGCSLNLILTANKTKIRLDR